MKVSIRWGIFTQNKIKLSYVKVLCVLSSYPYHILINADFVPAAIENNTDCEFFIVNLLGFHFWPLKHFYV